MNLVFQFVGTIARKKKSLNHLINTIRLVCEKKIKSNPKKIVYLETIETCIEKLQDVIHSEFNLSADLSRWISLKLLDNEETILKSIEKNLSINLLKNEKIQNVKNEIQTFLKKNGIDSNHLRDLIVSDIMHKSEEICKKVCTFENTDYSNRDRKIDKILTSKKFGIPIMIFFLGVIFWLTIVGSNYPSQALFTFFSWLQEKLVLLADFLHCPRMVFFHAYFWYLPNTNMDYISNVTSYGHFLPSFYYFRRFRIPS